MNDANYNVVIELAQWAANIGFVLALYIFLGFLPNMGVHVFHATATVPLNTRRWWAIAGTFIVLYLMFWR